MTDGSFEYSVQQEGETSIIALRGAITERSNFQPLIDQLGKRVEIDLSGVDRINSLGVAVWIRFMHHLLPRDVVLVRCAPVMVQQFYLMRNARGHGRIRSVMLPFCCGRCHNECTKTLDLENKSAPRIPEKLTCSACGGDMSFDDLPEMYLSPLLREEEDLLVGSVLDGGYELVERVAIGGTSRVYRGVQSRVLGRTVAVKVLSSSYLDNDAATRRFENEARIIAHLRHPNTVKLLDFGRLQDGRLYLITEFMVGRTLEDVLKNGPLEIDHTLKIMSAICDSLSEAHSVGIVHRDLKPANIFLETVADQEIIKVLDFGTAKQLSSPGVTAPMVIFGTPAYMSPEQARGETVDARSDLYSLGTILYECLTGRPLFTGSTPFSLMLKHAFERPEPVELHAPQASGDLAKLVLRLLSKDPAQRPPNTAAIRKEIDALLRERMISEVARERMGKMAGETLPPADRTARSTSSEEVLVHAPMDLHEATDVKDESEMRAAILAAKQLNEEGHLREDTLVRGDSGRLPTIEDSSDIPNKAKLQSDVREQVTLKASEDSDAVKIPISAPPLPSTSSETTDPPSPSTTVPDARMASDAIPVLPTSSDSWGDSNDTAPGEAQSPVRQTQANSSQERTLIELISGPQNPVPPPIVERQPSREMPAVIKPPSFPATGASKPAKPTGEVAALRSQPRFPAPRPTSRGSSRVPLNFSMGGKTPPPDAIIDPPRARRNRFERQALLIALIGLMIAAIGIAWIFAFRPV